MLLAAALVLAANTTPQIPSISISSLDSGAFVAECEKNRELQGDMCTSFILGVADALQINGITCRPGSDAATLQTVTIVRRFIHDHPEKWGNAPVALVQEPLIQNFGCAKSPR